jgi:hypothetical protein
MAVFATIPPHRFYPKGQIPENRENLKISYFYGNDCLRSSLTRLRRSGVSRVSTMDVQQSQSAFFGVRPQRAAQVSDARTIERSA